MPGLDPGIHANTDGAERNTAHEARLPAPPVFAWMPGSPPGHDAAEALANTGRQSLPSGSPHPSLPGTEREEPAPGLDPGGGARRRRVTAWGPTPVTTHPHQTMSTGSTLQISTRSASLSPASRASPLQTSRHRLARTPTRPANPGSASGADATYLPCRPRPPDAASHERYFFRIASRVSATSCCCSAVAGSAGLKPIWPGIPLPFLTTMKVMSGRPAAFSSRAISSRTDFHGPRAVIPTFRPRSP